MIIFFRLETCRRARQYTLPLFWCIMLYSHEPHKDTKNDNDKDANKHAPTAQSSIRAA